MLTCNPLQEATPLRHMLMLDAVLVPQGINAHCMILFNTTDIPNHTRQQEITTALCQI
jgi:hypothetical protein